MGEQYKDWCVLSQSHRTLFEHKLELHERRTDLRSLIVLTVGHSLN